MDSNYKENDKRTQPDPNKIMTEENDDQKINDEINATDKGLGAASCSLMESLSPYFETVKRSDGSKIINLGGYRQSDIQIIFNDHSMTIEVPGQTIGIGGDSMSIIKELITALQDGALQGQKIQLDLS